MKISDLKAVEGTIKAGFPPEFPEREEGYLGIQKNYRIQFSRVKIRRDKYS